MAQQAPFGKQNFILLFEANGASVNIDPATGLPRTTIDGRGDMGAECLKRKIRNRLQDIGRPILLQSDARDCHDGLRSVAARAKVANNGETLSNADPDGVRKVLLDTFEDCRIMGGTVALKGEVKGKGLSLQITGPLTIMPVYTVAPITIMDYSITKCVNNEEEDAGTRGSDTMGHRYCVRHGLYVAYGTINARIAERTGMTKQDLEDVKLALSTLFENDESAARPAGSMVVRKLFWFDHEGRDGKYAEYKVFDSLKITTKKLDPTRWDDYEISIDESYQTGAALPCVEVDVP